MKQAKQMSLQETLVKMGSLRAPSRSGDELRELATALRSVPEIALSYNDLHAVKTACEAGISADANAAEVTARVKVAGETTESASLRDMAHALRQAAETVDQRTREKAANVLIAAKGLTILRNRTQGAS